MRIDAIRQAVHASVVCASLAGGCRSGDGTPLPVIGDVPEFHLTDQASRALSRGDLFGRVWVADFIFTRCAGPCPLMTARMARLQGVVADLTDVRLVSFSVDPERDTPAVLREYAARHGAQAGRWHFLTGPRADIYDLAKRGFHLTVQSETDTTPLLHSTYFMLVDRRGRIRGAYNGEDDEALERLKRDVRRLASEPS